MHELRYNPLSMEWVIVSSSRSQRPNLPKDSCPLCPGVLELDDDYDLAAFDNRFPSLSGDTTTSIINDEVLINKKAYGKCEVVIYTSDHQLSVPHMPTNQLTKLIEVWCDRVRNISRDEEIKYIFIFENRGKEVGATLQHAHGQLYSFPFIPKRVQAKLQGLRKHYYKTKECLICSLLNNQRYRENIVYENDNFVTLIPYFARFPYECHIYPKRHISSITEMNAEEKRDMAYSIRDIVRRYDKLFDSEFPYMMMLFGNPVNYEESTEEYFHFHIEFNPPKRTADKMKWMASVETGTWTFINPAQPEEAAKELRDLEV